MDDLNARLEKKAKIQNFRPNIFVTDCSAFEEVNNCLKCLFGGLVVFLCNSVSLCDGAYKDEESCSSMIFTTQFQRERKLLLTSMHMKH